MKLYQFPDESRLAVKAQKKGEEYLLSAHCVVCGGHIISPECIYGFEPRCEDHELLSEGIALIEVRTAPHQSTIIVDPNPGIVYKHGEPVPGTPGWIYTGCPDVISRMRRESPQEHLLRAQVEADSLLNDSYQGIDW